LYSLTGYGGHYGIGVQAVSLAGTKKRIERRRLCKVQNGGDDLPGAGEMKLIGGGGGVSAEIWEMQLQSAPSVSGRRVYHWTGTEIGTKPVHQHCTAEGL